MNCPIFNRVIAAYIFFADMVNIMPAILYFPEQFPDTHFRLGGLGPVQQAPTTTNKHCVLLELPTNVSYLKHQQSLLLT